MKTHDFIAKEIAKIMERQREHKIKQGLLPLFIVQKAR